LAPTPLPARLIGTIAISRPTTPGAGGIAGNYFFTRYLGAGLQGYALGADDIIGQTAGNLIFRYPIPGTRVAPYGFAGGGVLFNGSRAEDLVDRGHNLVSVTRHSMSKAWENSAAVSRFASPRT